MSDYTSTPQQTLQAATYENALAPSRLTLIGTIIKPGSAKALVRSGAGQIKSVTLGDEIGGAKIVAIDDGVIVLSQQGRTRKLTLPARPRLAS